MKIIYLALMILSFNSLAEAALECSKEGVVIFYVNGQENEKEDAKATTNKLTSLIRGVYSSIQLDKKKVFVDYSYNRTFGKNQQGVAMADFLESAALLLASRQGVTLEEAWVAAYRTLMNIWHPTDPLDRSLMSKTQAIELLDTPEILNQLYSATAVDLQAIKTKTKDYLSEDKKIIFTSHSQGNLFVNVLYNQLVQENPTINNKPFVDFLEILGNIQIATPSENIPIEKHRWVTNNMDAILNVPFRLNPNFSLSLPFNDPRSDLADQTKNHSMLDTYLGGGIGDIIRGNLPELRDMVFNELEKIALDLKSNCVAEGCDGAPGKMSQAQGGAFVANTAYLGETVSVSSFGTGIEICERAQVYGNARISGFIKISGTAQIHGNAQVNGFGSGVEIKGNADILGSVNNYGPLVIMGSTKIKEGSSISGEGILDGSTEIGSSEVTLDRTYVDDSTIFGSKVYLESYVNSSTIKNSNIKASGVSDSTIENSVVDASGIVSSTIKNSTVIKGSSVNESNVEGSTLDSGAAVDMSTVKNSIVKDSSLIQESTIENSMISEGSFIYKSNFSNFSCVGAYMMNNQGGPCYQWSGSVTPPILP